jgi:ubiquinol cytochrome c reductase Fe-S subunit
MSDVSHRVPDGAQQCAAHSPDSSRRRFLMFGAGAAGAAGAAAAAPLVAAEAAVVEAAADPRPSQGYRETDHVRTYYATTRI